MTRELCRRCHGMGCIDCWGAGFTGTDTVTVKGLYRPDYKCRRCGRSAWFFDGYGEKHNNRQNEIWVCHCGHAVEVFPPSLEIYP